MIIRLSPTVGSFFPAVKFFDSNIAISDICEKRDLTYLDIFMVSYYKRPTRGWMELNLEHELSRTPVT